MKLNITNIWKKNKIFSNKKYEDISKKKNEEIINNFNTSFPVALEKKIGKVISVNKNNLEIEKDIQREVFDYYEKNIENDRLSEHKINKNRIFEFLKQYGFLPPKNILFVYKKDLLPISEIYIKYGYGIFSPLSIQEHQNMISEGLHEGRADLTFVILDCGDWNNIDSYEEIVKKESCAIHEATHSIRGYYSNLISQSEPNTHNHKWLRVGMRTKNLVTDKEQGYFLEEGFVRFIQKEYTQKFRSQEINAKINHIPKSGPWEDIEPGRITLEWDDKISVKTTDFMGIGMETLFKAKPELLNAFIEARKSNGINGKPLQDIAKIINSFNLPSIEKNGKTIKRSLYKELRDLPYSDEWAIKGFNLIQEATKGETFDIKSEKKENI